MKKSCLMFSLLFIMMSVTIVAAEANIPDGVQEASLKGLQWAKNIVTSNPEKWDISDISKLDSITIGKGIEVYKIDKERLNDSSESILENSFPSGEWRFTIYVEKSPKFFIFIGKDKGKYTVIRFGQTKYDLETELISFKNSINASKNPTYVTIGLGDCIVGLEDGIEKVALLNKFVEMNEENSESLKLDINDSKGLVKDYFKMLKMVKEGKALEIPLGGESSITQASSRLLKNHSVMFFGFELCSQ